MRLLHQTGPPGGGGHIEQVSQATGVSSRTLYAWAEEWNQAKKSLVNHQGLGGEPQQGIYLVYVPTYSPSLNGSGLKESGNRSSVTSMKKDG